ncbi:hypothetical protein GCM10027449_05320 [Sinomonas notoginsengisoli]
MDVEVGHGAADADDPAEDAARLGFKLAAEDAVDVAVAVTVTVGAGVAHAVTVGVGLAERVPSLPATFDAVVVAAGAERLPATAVLMPKTTSDPATRATAGPRRTYLLRRNNHTSPMTKPIAAMTETTTGITPSRMSPTMILPRVIQIFDALLMAAAPPFPHAPQRGSPLARMRRQAHPSFSGRGGQTRR